MLRECAVQRTPTRCSHQVRQTNVLLGFHRCFHASFVHGQRVNVEFSFSKRVYKLMLQAWTPTPPIPAPHCRHRRHYHPAGCDQPTTSRLVCPSYPHPLGGSPASRC